MDTYILGISCYYHDSAAAILRNGEIIAAAQEERFSRIKHDAAFPKSAVAYCLSEAGVSLDDLTAVVFYDKPLLKFERLLETYYTHVPRGLGSFLKAMPVWIKQKIFLKREIKKELKEVQAYAPKQLKLLFTEHHLSHAASSYYPSGFEQAAVLTIDGVGEWTTASIGLGRGKQLSVLKELHFPHSVGLLYSAFTYFLGFKVNSGEYKLMGLAPYGDPNDPQTGRFVAAIQETLVDIRVDGSIHLNQSYFDYAVGLRMVKQKKWEALFGMALRHPEQEMTQGHCNLAYAIQAVTEEIVLRLAQEAKRLTGMTRLCLSGGVALNCVANGKLEAAGVFDEIYVQPASGDAGGALGAALAAHFLYLDGAYPVSTSGGDGMRGAYLGPQVDTKAWGAWMRKQGVVSRIFTERSDLVARVAALLAEGQVIGWFQGRMEFGPRALGNRSILGDPRNPEMQKRINLKIKYRESFRPFAPAILEEDASEYFDMQRSSPYMLKVYPVAEEWRCPLPAHYAAMNMRNKLYQRRSQWQAITHVDMSARVQTVSATTNPVFWELISAFKAQTGCPMLINTSFNVRGEPIVCTAEDAYRCFMRTEMDYLVIEDCLFSKVDQPKWDVKDAWQQEFLLD
ncbi:hypothetical protein BFP72_12865 [Reichenbachiella sp. 5M10]|uniref:carbamoyltransferase family protein n=1 Tax=Reichenbachiella sp. 5M10 TaxID=1889772 RepID=UPI000C1532E4|nr:carbamoyltransferase [Reichenbachiella sp. 5M10]PIB36218.1 hypothetical protein BFP72_12865 [Reichenbachiella sp. 5M10]